jgi:hypothetical protein
MKKKIQLIKSELLDNTEISYLQLIKYFFCEKEGISLEIATEYIPNFTKHFERKRNYQTRSRRSNLQNF